MPAEDFSAMDEVVSQNIAALEAARDRPRAARGALGSLLDNLTTSGLFVAATEGVPETKELHDQGCALLERVSVAIGSYLDGAGGAVGGTTLEVALQAKSFVDYFREVAARLGEETINAPAAGETPLEDPPVGDDELEDPGDPNLRGGEAIRSPHVFFPPHGPCKEESFPLAVECGGCAVVIKEFRGLQLRLVRRRLTRAVEPWYSRRSIIHVWVWVFEWVPVQLIKTITVRCSGDKPETFVQKKLVLDRELMTFWRCH